MTTPEERLALRAQHTCMRDLSSMRCSACNRGVPYPHPTEAEIKAWMLGLDQHGNPSLAFDYHPPPW